MPIGRITTNGIITIYPSGGSGQGPFGIIKGPDGNLWYTISSTSSIGRISVSGQITTYRSPIIDARRPTR